MKKKLFFCVAPVALFAAIMGGCSQIGAVGGSSSADRSSGGVGPDAPTVAATGEIKRTELTENAKFAAELRAEPGPLKAGSDAALVFTIRDKQGAIATDLKVVHEKLMHLLIVSEDLAQFDHVHPERQEDGSFRVSYKFPNGGVYKLYSDFTPQGATQIVDRFDVTVGGPSREKTPLAADTNFTKTVDGLNFTLKADQPIRAGSGTMLSFYVTDASGHPVADLQPYLGAMAHFVVISQDTTKFLHVHAMEGATTETKGAGGHKDSHGEMEMGVGTDTENAAKPTVQAHTEFPAAGLYKLWGQFQRGGKVFTVPFVLKIEEGGAETADAAEMPAGAIRINVSGNGFEPSEVAVKKGQPVRLAFSRKDSNNCASEVVFSKLNMKKPLPAGKTTIIEVTPGESGELGFACGMGMFSGKLIVQ